MKITYHGHACFTVESNGYSIVLDPYKDTKGFKDVELTANDVICSHEHFDHGYREGVTIIPNSKKVFNVTTVKSFHDDAQGAKRGLNDITILEAEGKRVAHLGDLGHMLSEEQAEALQNLDVLMIPVGGFFTIDPKQAVEIIKQLNPKTVIPMHYKDGEKGLDVIAGIDEFLGLAEGNINSKIALVRGYEESIELASILIEATDGLFDGAFSFDVDPEGGAWYDLDGVTASCGSMKLRINADREVYGIFTNADGEEHYGTIGDADNEVLADNFGIEDGEIYYFYEKPETKDYYV